MYFSVFLLFFLYILVLVKAQGNLYS